MLHWIVVAGCSVWLVAGCGALAHGFEPQSLANTLPPHDVAYSQAGAFAQEAGLRPGGDLTIAESEWLSDSAESDWSTFDGTVYSSKVRASEVHASEVHAPETDGGMSNAQLRKLMRPDFRFATEWQAETNDVGISSYDAGVSIPSYPFFGPPPPFFSPGFAYTKVDSPSALGLPDDLYETQLGFAWMRRWNDRWMLRFMAGTSFATDGQNVSSDAWRFRGGAFAIYKRSSVWTWTFGAIALGRNDLPVLPAVGAIYQPNRSTRFDLIMPRPRVSFLLVDNGPRQQWGYLGAGLNGTTWGAERADGVDDQLTYGDVRLVLGWESTPTPEPGVPFTRGRKLGAEIGYVFSRDFEWEYDESKIRLDDTFMLRGSVSF